MITKAVFVFWVRTVVVGELNMYRLSRESSCHYFQVYIYIYIYIYLRGKVIPLQARCGPEGG